MLSYNQSVVSSLMLDIATPNNVFCDKQQIYLDSLSFSSGTPYSDQLEFYVRSDMFPRSTEVIVSGSFVAGGGNGNDLRTVEDSFTLPTELFCIIVPPINAKETHKLTIITDQGAIPISHYFNDIVNHQNASEICETTPNAMTFMFHNGVSASILISKNNAGKFRIQSDSFEALGFLLKELVHRVEIDCPGADIKMHESVPLNELFTTIDEHFMNRQEIASLKKQLEDSSFQFRIVQKRLLNRFKDKNPSPLNNLDFLINQTYFQLCALASKTQDHQNALKIVGYNLGIRVDTILFILKYKFELNEESYEILKAHLSPNVDDTNQ